ncbi:DUF3365 domain-containing protein [Candidatus Kaistella beijingensis]|uniref:c-type heme family protein n=1 Tax=Candidatus Kaistella beijingensis TaxID=2820270 RepID=UPI001CC68DB3|nr:DUF3365 domain-containing protein [Candidatus Kaistella beijingensis]UBB90394.1 DUF3365 domain-containing protein [Candidatus Kaistella beijingensis]
MKNLYLGILFSATAIVSCNQQNGKKGEVIPEDNIVKLSESETLEGFGLMKTNCYACHNPVTPESERVAPPMIAIKARYLAQQKTKGEFIAEIWNYVQKPDSSKSKLPGAVQRYGLMPYQSFHQKDIEKIAAFIYDYKIPEPEWFKEHYKKQMNAEFNQNGKPIPASAKTKEEIAMDYALETKQLLGKNLQKKLKEEGAEKALEFCNVEAIPLTKSVSDKYKVAIKRVSDQPRNPRNLANAEELKIINKYKADLVAGKSVKGMMLNDHQFYMPITTNTMCLQCHGTVGKEIKPNVAAEIKKLYPKDKATGYQENQLRGIFSVTMK